MKTYRADENIRLLGNDVVHEKWREVGAEEIEDCHSYTQRILEDLYDHRESVETVLTAKERKFTPIPRKP